MIPLPLSRIFLALGASMLIIAVAATACSDGESGAAVGQPPTVAGELPSELAKVEEAYRALRERFVDREKLDSEKFSQAAVRAMVDSLDDRFTTYFTAERFRMTQETFRGTFEGIGANVTVGDGRVTIVAPLPDSPAQRAGIMPADVILVVDGEPVEGFSLGMVIDRIRGPEGEPVRLRIERPETGEVIDVTIVREGIRHITTTFELVADRVARVQITQFVATTVDELKRVLDEVLELGVAGVVLDLRNNPGGLVTSVVDVASQFLSQGLVLSQIDADGLTALADGFTPDQLPVVVDVLDATYGIYSVMTEIGQSAGRISENVRALKAYSYLDQAPVQDVDVHEGLDNTLLVLGHKLKSGISVRKEYAPHLPSIHANGSELNQVWTNIIDNAADALEGQGEVTIRTRQDGDWVVIEIEDDGPGIPAEIQSRIFEPFFTTKPSGLGIGLGLDISQNIIVQKHQGDIKVISEPGKTCFEVWLPVTPP